MCAIIGTMHVLDTSPDHLLYQPSWWFGDIAASASHPQPESLLERWAFPSEFSVLLRPPCWGLEWVGKSGVKIHFHLGTKPIWKDGIKIQLFVRYLALS